MFVFGNAKALETLGREDGETMMRERPTSGQAPIPAASLLPHELRQLRDPALRGEKGCKMRKLPSVLFDDEASVI